MRVSSLIFIAFLFLTLESMGQKCPLNIGFEQGDFQHWLCESGSIATNGVISLDPSGPVSDRHEIIAATSALVTDPYGGFPVNAPNGSGYSTRIGSTQTGTMADRISYTFTVPESQMDYSIIYNYAVVFFNPPNNHEDFEQPKFTARAFDVSANRYIDCGSFDFVSSTRLPGFQQSSVNKDIYYKPWAPITLNLVGFAGKTIRLELTVNGCTKNRGSHFGYAYIDVNENCDSPVSGNIICDPLSSITLSAPAGFMEYYWYNTADLSKELGTSHSLTLDPAPPPGSRFAVKIVPYPGLGCANTLYTTTAKGDALKNFFVTDFLETCYPAAVDLTKAVAGNDPELTYTYYTDQATTNYVRLPSAVIEDGTYFIKATNGSGCYLVKPVRVKINQVKLEITDPPPSCFPGSVDITDKTVTAGSEENLSYTFWQDAGATIPLLNPGKLETSGTYYIKAINPGGCFTVKPVNVVIANLVTHSQSSCKSVNLTTSSVTADSTPGFVFTYWMDSMATVPVSNPAAVTVSGTYYIKGTNAGCSKVVPIEVLVNPLPLINISTAYEVDYPEKVNLVASGPTNGLTYTYWKDQAASVTLPHPEAVETSGTYYIKITNENGCSSIFPATVIINEPPYPGVITTNTFTPNNDGVNDLFTINMVGIVRINYLKIFNRWGQIIFSTKQTSDSWDGTFDGKSQPSGTYYWILDGIDEYRNQLVKKSGAITLIR